MLELFRVIANEWMKLLRRKRLWVAGILMLLTIGLFGIAEYHSHKDALNNTPQMQLTNVQQMLTNMKAHPNSNDPGYNQQIQGLEQQIATLKTEIAAEQPGNAWKTSMEQVKSNLQKSMDAVPASERSNSQAWNNAYSQLLQVNYQLQHNIRPLQPWQLSPYSEMMQYLSFAARLFLPLVVVILVADMIAGEATDGTIKLLLVRPVSRAKILLGKWITSLLVSALATAVIGAALWAVGVVILGNVGASEPMLVGGQVKTISAAAANAANQGSGGIATAPVTFPVYAHASVIPMWHYMLGGLGLTVFAMLVVATITFLCSTIFRSAMASTGVALGVTIIGFVVTEMAMHVRWIVDLFFPVHLALFDNWSGQLSMQAGMNASLALGVIVLAVWGIVTLAVALYTFARRDVLNA